MKKYLTICLIVAVFLAAVLLQWGVDRTAAGTPQRGKGKIQAASLMDFLGGVRQYLAYSLYIKTDELHHAYYGAFSAEAELVPYLILITLLDPHYIDAYYVACGIIAEYGNLDQAMELALRGVEINPHSADLYYNLADLYILEKRYGEAAAAMEKALEFTPENVSRSMLMKALSASYKAMGEDEKARQAIMKRALSNEVLKYVAFPSAVELENVINRINADYNDAASVGLGSE